MAEPGWIGRELGHRYRLDSLLGQGGMSSVYKATDPNLRRAVAVKLIHSHLTSDPEFVRRFEVEASAVAQLHHPNIIQVYDFNRDGSTYYMVLEFVHGESLDRRLRRLAKEGQRMLAEQAANITAEVADALDYAHAQGLIHRDIKPGNIMLDERGHAVLMDFGLAKIVGATQFTGSGEVMGTPAYIAPELVRGKPPSPGSDIYALGASLFEMLAGRPPFTGDSALSVMMKQLNEPPPDLRQLAPGTPPALVAVVETALAKEPQQRFASARDMLAALRLGPASAPNPRAAEGQAAPVAATPATILVAENSAAPALRAGQPAPVKPVPANPSAPPAASGSGASGSSVPSTGVPAHHASRVLWLGAGGLALLLCLAVAVTGLLGGVLVLPSMIGTSTAAPPASTPQVLYKNELTQSSADWPTLSGPNGSAGFGQDAYVIEDLHSSNFVPVPANTGDLNNIHAEVTAASTGQANDAGFGLICDYQDASHFYYFGITPGGEYAILKHEPGHVTDLTDDRGQWVQSTRIIPGAQSYLIGIDCGSDGTLTLYVEGQRIATANDTAYSSGRIGVFVQTGVGAPAEVQYRNVIVTALK